MTLFTVYMHANLTNTMSTTDSVHVIQGRLAVVQPFLSSLVPGRSALQEVFSRLLNHAANIASTTCLYSLLRSWGDAKTIITFISATSVQGGPSHQGVCIYSSVSLM
jgi:hypothetical protein